MLDTCLINVVVSTSCSIRFSLITFVSRRFTPKKSASKQMALQSLTEAAPMSPTCDLRRTKRSSFAYGLFVAIALFALLTARSVPPDFPGAPGFHTSIHSVSHHQQRPRFNCETPNWSVATATVTPAPPDAESAHVFPSHDFLSTFSTKGFRFNRPPPAV